MTKRLHLNMPLCLEPEKHDRQALNHYLGLDRLHVPWQTEGASLSSDVVLYRVTGGDPKVTTAFGLFVRFGDQWAHLADIPADDPALASIKQRITRYGSMPRSTMPRPEPKKKAEPPQPKKDQAKWVN